MDNNNKQLLLPFLVPPGNHKSAQIKRYLSFKCSKCSALLYTDKKTLCTKCSQLENEKPKCDCGATKCKLPVHSDWCSTQKKEE